jgi:predicted small integral membrane protein
VLLAGFVAWERRHPEPLMRFGLLRTRTVSGANVAGFIMGTAMFAMFLMLTLYMQQVLGYSAMKTGLAYFTQVSVGGSYLGDLLPGFLLVAIGIGFSFVPISIAALAGVKAAEAGLASGLINTSPQIGRLDADPPGRAPAVGRSRAEARARSRCRYDGRAASVT